MDNPKDVNHDLLASGQLEVEEQSAGYFKNAGLWAKTIAFVLTILCGLTILAVVYLGRFFGGIGMYKDKDYLVFMAIVVLIIIALASIFIVNLFRFSSGMAAGIANHDTPSFTKGITGLRNFFIFTGIFTLLLAFIYIVRLVS